MHEASYLAAVVDNVFLKVFVRFVIFVDADLAATQRTKVRSGNWNRLVDRTKLGLTGVMVLVGQEDDRAEGRPA